MSVDKTRPPTFEEWAKEAKRLPKDTILKLWWEKIEECWKYQLSAERRFLFSQNISAMRRALDQAKAAILAARDKMGVENPIILEIIDVALAMPARNCDVYDAHTAEKEFIRQTGSKSIRSKSVRWLYAPADNVAPIPAQLDVQALDATGRRGKGGAK